MKYRELSKLQIRAEITLMLQKMNSLDEMSREQQAKCISKLNSIKDSEYVVELLAKELGRSDYKKGQIICLFLQELGSLESLSQILWSYIKSPSISDEIKDLAGVTLKNLGDETDTEEFLTYLKNPKAIVDKETKKLLEVTSVNPEAQIDFLDFLFSLPETEQVNLISSLREDYSSDYILNVAAPALESRMAQHMDELFMEILSETKSPKAAHALNDFITYSDDERKKKKAKVSLNILKLAGVDIENPSFQENTEDITKISEIYECHTCLPDGVGNQAVITSRIRPNGDVLMMNVVINDVHGVLDCFGFWGISKNDFTRIIEKFQEKNTRFIVPPEYCKYILLRSEKINKVRDTVIPYEFIAWKSMLRDVNLVIPNLEKETKKWAKEKLIDEEISLFKFPDFSHWFFEDEDHPEVKSSLEKIINEIREKKEFYINNISELNKTIEKEINILIEKIFDKDVRNIFKSRFQNIAYLFKLADLPHFREIAATFSRICDPESKYDLSRSLFFREIIKKTIIEGFLRYQYNLQNEEKQVISPWHSKKAEKVKSGTKTGFQEKSVEDIIEILCRS
jgi:hypothetical protein